MCTHLVCQSCENHGSCLTSTTVITKDLNDTVLKGVILNNFLLEIIGTNHFRKYIRFELFCLVMVLKRVTILVGSVKELLDLLLELAWIVVNWHEHDILSEWIRARGLNFFRSFFLLDNLIGT